MVHWKAIKFCRILDNFYFINWSGISMLFYFILSIKINLSTWVEAPLISSIMIFVQCFLIELAIRKKKKQNRSLRRQEFYRKTGVLQYQRCCWNDNRDVQRHPFLCVWVSTSFKRSEPMGKFSLADPPNLSTLFSHSASKASTGLKAKGTVVYPSLSNFNVHMNNIEILSGL